ncbi:MAG: zinc-ribbon and DUF3426 domain-containing protein [Gammaproteobacteria bacterium]
MADNKYQTQCPHCGVKFQITDQHLALAKGNVRCGSCLQVFQASQHLVPLAATPPPGTGSARAAPPPPAPASAPRPSATAPQRPAATQPRQGTPPPASKTDDDLADMILRELEDTPPSRPSAPAPRPAAAAPVPPAATQRRAAPADEPQWTPPRPAEQAHKPHLSIGGELDDSLLSDEDPFGASTSGHPGLHREDAADESWAKALLGEGEGSETDDRVRKFVNFSADKLSMAERTGVQPRSDIERRLDAIARGDTHAGSPGSPHESPADEFDFLNDDNLSTREVNLRSTDSDDFSEAVMTHEVSWARDAVWTMLTGVFLLLLGGQYLVYNFDTLAREDSWRGVYAAACDALGCTLPESSDITRIQGANLVVRSHPTIAQALIVDAIVYNRAPFAQPFPRLELSFNDVRGNTIAGRVFEPAEYLGGELAGADSMPPDTPVHLTLELVDPGPEAAGYAMRLLPPASS